MEEMIKTFLQEITWGHFVEKTLDEMISRHEEISYSQAEALVIIFKDFKTSSDNAHKIIDFCFRLLDIYEENLLVPIICCIANIVDSHANKRKMADAIDAGIKQYILNNNPYCPDTTSLLIGEGKKLERDYRWKEALSFFKLASCLTPLHREALKGCGECHYQMKDFSEAICYFVKTLELPCKLETNISLWKRIGLAYFHLEDYQTSLGFLRQSFQHTRELETAYFIGECLYRKKELEEGAKFVAKAIEEKGETGKLDLLLGKLYFDLGLYHEAQSSLNKSLSLVQDSLEAKGLINKVEEKLKLCSPDEEKEFLKNMRGLDLRREHTVNTSKNKKPEYRGVVGMEDVFEALEDAYCRITDAAGAAEFGLPRIDGILLIGPPGCGKTLSVKAFSKENNLVLHIAKLNEILNMWVGESEKAIHRLFEKARKDSPCILFFDELDSLGMTRNSRQDWVRTLVGTFLLELDDLNNSNTKGVILTGATNAAELIDPALSRPGRFGTHIKVQEPDSDMRKRLLDFYMAGIKVGCQNIDMDSLVRITKGWSCAQIRALTERAARAAWKEYRENREKRALNQRDFIMSFQRMKGTCMTEEIGFRKNKG